MPQGVPDETEHVQKRALARAVTTDQHGQRPQADIYIGQAPIIFDLHAGYHQ
jgi:hypothetical protein